MLGVRIVAAVVSLAIIVGAGYAWANYREFNAAVTRVDAIPTSDKGGAKDTDGKDQNILLVGIDDRDSISATQRKELGVPSDGGSINTDTMMILHVPANGEKASVVSFPRDTYVQIADGFGQAKLNSAYADGVSKYGKSRGWQVLVDTLAKLANVHIDHFVAVNLYGFYSITKAIGGVQVCLKQGYTAQQTNASLALPKGKFTVSGKLAVAFVRQRDNLPRGDLDRIVRQQYLLSAMFRKIASAGTLLNPIKTRHLVDSVAKSLQVDKHMDVLKIAAQMTDLTAGNLRFTQIPTTGSYVGNQSVQVTTTNVPTFVKNYFGTNSGSSAYSKAKAVDPSTVSVDVRNGSGRGSWASTNAAKLKTAGFTTSTGDWTSTISATTIYYKAGQEPQAKTLAKYVSGATVKVSSSVSEVTLVLGTDAKTASATPVKSSSSSTSTSGVRTAAQAGCIW